MFVCPLEVGGFNADIKSLSAVSAGAIGREANWSFPPAPESGSGIPRRAATIRRSPCSVSVSSEREMSLRISSAA